MKFTPVTWLAVLYAVEKTRGLVPLAAVMAEVRAPQGWYSKFDRVIKLSKQFKMPSVKAGDCWGIAGSNRDFSAQRHSILGG